MARTRERRRKGMAIAKVRLDPVERKKLIALGYLESEVAEDRGPPFDAAAEAYLSDKLAEESYRSAPVSEHAPARWQSPLRSRIGFGKGRLEQIEGAMHGSRQ